MNNFPRATGIANPYAGLMLADKSVYGNQALADWIDGEKETFEGDSTKQSRTLRRNEAWSRDFVTIETQPCFGYGPDISLSTCNHDALGAGGFQLKPFCQGSRHHGKRSAGVDKQLNFFRTPRRTGQTALYMKQSHSKRLSKTTLILARSTNNATTMVRVRKVFKPADLPVEQQMKFEVVVDLKTAKQIGLPIPPNILVRVDKVIR
jgi:hypothetical protein